VIGAMVAVSFPTNFLKNFSLLSFLSAIGIFSVLLIACVIVYDTASYAADPPQGAPPERVGLDAGRLPMAASIMLAGLTGHVSLPPMYAEMAEPSRFKPTLYASFGGMLALYMLVGVCGYVLYGAGASMLVTSDMSAAAHAGTGSPTLVTAVLVLITFKLFTGAPLCVLTLVDIAQNLYEQRTGQELSARTSDGVRMLIWAAAVCASIAFYDSLQYVTALIGINSMLISILLPILFYLQLHWASLSPPAKAGYAALLVASLVGTVVIACVDVQEFLESLASAGLLDGE
jgi:hypothetical protein